MRASSFPVRRRRAGSDSGRPDPARPLRGRRPLAGRQVLIDATGQQLASTIAGQRVGDIGDAFKEIAVVCDDDQRARPPVEEILDDRQRVDVEVVGRLIEQQHVRLVEQQPQKLQPTALAAGQVAEPRGQLVAGEPEVLQQRRRTDLTAAGEAGHPPAVLDRVQHAIARRSTRRAPGSSGRSGASCRA